LLAVHYFFENIINDVFLLSKFHGSSISEKVFGSKRTNMEVGVELTKGSPTNPNAVKCEI
jgi:hypothetical protein